MATRYTLDDVLAVLTAASGDLDDGHEDPHWIHVRATGRTPDGTETAVIKLTPMDDQGRALADEAERFNVTIKRAEA
jgi:hypothetical protein